MPATQKAKPIRKTTAAHEDNPEWTAAEAARAKKGAAFFAERGLVAPAPRRRGAQRRPIKQPVSIRLSPDVLTAFRRMGRGWQSRVDTALREWLAAH